MLDGEVPEKVEKVWGFTVPIMNGGRRRWPRALRAMAVEKVADGAGIREIAEEIGAHKSLVALWVKNAQSESSVPAFFEVVPPTALHPSHRQSRAVASEDDPAPCRIRIGDTDIAIPPGYPADHLAEVLRAVRASQ